MGHLSLGHLLTHSVYVYLTHGIDHSKDAPMLLGGGVGRFGLSKPAYSYSALYIHLHSCIIRVKKADTFFFFSSAHSILTLERKHTQGQMYISYAIYAHNEPEFIIPFTKASAYYANCA